MATWEELSQECFLAAKSLLDAGHYRRSVSSSYYAAYSAVAGLLISRGVNFAHGWNNPGHDQLPELILNNSGLPRHTRYELNKAIRRLRLERENADYRPRMVLLRRNAVDCIHDAALILDFLEVGQDGTD